MYTSCTLCVFGGIKWLYFIPISEIMKSLVILVSIPMTLLLYSTFSYEIEGNRTSRSTLPPFCCTLGGIHQHENLTPRTLYYI